MISLKICGRAGNQFFQYGYVQTYVDQNFPKEIINISFEYLEKKKTDNKTFFNVLEMFNISEVKYINKIQYSIKQKILDFLYVNWNRIIRLKVKLLNRKISKKDYYFMNKYFAKILNHNGLYYYFPGVKKFYESKNNNIIFFGTFEDCDYFKKNKEFIKRLFIPKGKISKNNSILYQEIKENESVCVTIRRGDFLNSKFKKNFYICDKKYFESAIKKFVSMNPKSKFFIFSDDVEWCKKNICVPNGTVYETSNNSISEKIRLMSSCKHFIISNSTFSWWAQFLSNSPNKKVIAPKIWNKYEFSDSIYDSDWILQ